MKGWRFFSRCIRTEHMYTSVYVEQCQNKHGLFVSVCLGELPVGNCGRGTERRRQRKKLSLPFLHGKFKLPWSQLSKVHTYHKILWFPHFVNTAHGALDNFQSNCIRIPVYYFFRYFRDVCLKKFCLFFFCFYSLVFRSRENINEMRNI